MDWTRRSVVGGLAATTAQMLWCGRIAAMGVAAGEGGGRTSAAPGLLDVALFALSPRTLQISISPANDAPRLRELGVLERVRGKAIRSGVEAREYIVWGKYRLELRTGPLRVAAFAGQTRLQEIRFAPDSTDVHFDVAGPVFGLGEGVHPFDRRETQDAMENGQHGEELKTFGARLPIPWVMSPAGWGVFIGQPSGSFRFSQTEAVFREEEASSARNVFLVLGDSPGEVLREYAGLTGFPHLPPLWAFGYQQSHRTLASEDEIVTEARTFREKRLPCDAMIYLGTGFCPSGWNTGHGSFTFNERVFPDPAKTLRDLHAEQMKVVLHVVPPGDFHGSVADVGGAAEAPGNAARYWAEHRAIARYGVDGWWPDEGDRLSVYARLDRNRMYWEGSRADEPEKRPFALHRNGYAGLQRYGWLWSGDTFSTWDALRAQVMNGINVGLSGIPFWGTDTGGFVPTPEYGPELFMRWFQFSAFCPSFRSHGRAWKLHLPWGWDLGTAEPKEVEGDWTASWPAGADLHRPEIEEICRSYLTLRYQMLPYIYSTARESHRSGVPMIRALWLAYPDDSRAAPVDDSYLWGESFLVAPVCEKGAVKRPVYLPRGGWWNFWTNERLDGGREVTMAADFRTMPLLVKAGAVVPMGPVKQHTGEVSSEPVTLEIYPGADGRFLWYDDDGRSFRYEQGEFMEVLCEWQDASRVLTLTRSGAGRLGEGRTVRVRLRGTERVQNVRLTGAVTRVRL